VPVPEERRPSPACIRLDRVTVRFGRHDVLHDVSLVIPEGEHVCVRGAGALFGASVLLVVLALWTAGALAGRAS